MELERRKTRNFLKEMKQLIFVFIGGGLGSILRYLTVKYLNNYSATIPFGTFIANILGSLGIGIVLGMAIKNNSLNHHQTLFLATGFCGGFTTFSSFAYENHIFLKNGDLVLLALYTIASLIVAFLAVFVGVYLIKILV